jgi:hypothetical protein
MMTLRQILSELLTNPRASLMRTSCSTARVPASVSIQMLHGQIALVENSGADTSPRPRRLRAP